MNHCQHVITVSTSTISMSDIKSYKAISFRSIKSTTPFLEFCAQLIVCYRWIINMEGAQGTLYEGEQFQLQFKFSPKYPFDSPEVSTVKTLCL